MPKGKILDFGLEKLWTKFSRLGRDVTWKSSLVSNFTRVEWKGIEKGKIRVYNKTWEGVCACHITAGIEIL